MIFFFHTEYLKAETNMAPRPKRGEPMTADAAEDTAPAQPASKRVRVQFSTPDGKGTDTLVDTTPQTDRDSTMLWSHSLNKYGDIKIGAFVTVGANRAVLRSPDIENIRRHGAAFAYNVDSHEYEKRPDMYEKIKLAEGMRTVHQYENSVPFDNLCSQEPKGTVRITSTMVIQALHARVHPLMRRNSLPTVSSAKPSTSKILGATITISQILSHI